jgi:hypothetical protein
VSAPDASVWTSEPTKEDGDYQHATIQGEPCGVVRLTAGTRCANYWMRSILPVPSAERHAALEAVAEAEREWHGGTHHEPGCRICAALARLEATR